MDAARAFWRRDLFFFAAAFFSSLCAGGASAARLSMPTVAAGRDSPSFDTTSWCIDAAYSAPFANLLTSFTIVGNQSSKNVSMRPVHRAGRRLGPRLAAYNIVDDDGAGERWRDRRHSRRFAGRERGRELRRRGRRHSRRHILVPEAAVADPSRALAAVGPFRVDGVNHPPGALFVADVSPVHTQPRCMPRIRTIRAQGVAAVPPVDRLLPAIAEGGRSVANV